MRYNDWNFLNEVEMGRYLGHTKGGVTVILCLVPPDDKKINQNGNSCSVLSRQ